VKAEYLQYRKNGSDNSVFVKRCLLLSKVGDHGNIVFRTKATGNVKEEQEGENIIYPHGMK